MLDVGGLGLLGAKEFPARGEVEEQLPHLHAGAGGAAGGFDFENGAAIDQNLRALGRDVVAFAGGEGEAADAGDARDGLAAEPHGGDGGEILGALDLAGGVAFEREQGVIAAHAEAVVGHADEAAAAGADLDGDLAGPGVQGVFDQFFDHAGRPFNHLASGDLVGNLFGKQMDPVHRRKRVMHGR